MNLAGSRHSTQRRAHVAEEVHATAPRQVLPGRIVFITSRAVDRTFRLMPREGVVESLLFCFAVAVAKKEFKIRVHEVVYRPNHLHFVATFGDTSVPDFMQCPNSLCWRQLNALRGRSGTNFETHFNAVEVADPQKVLEHCAYTLANPCAGHLVTQATAWKGVTSTRLEYGKPTIVERPKTECGSPNVSRRRPDRRRGGTESRGAGASRPRWRRRRTGSR